MDILPWEDNKRLPDLTAEAKAILRKMVEHPQAPIFRNRSGHFLTQADRRAHFDFALQESLRDPRLQVSDPAWLKPFLAKCENLVPFYRGYNWTQSSFQELPIITRKDLSDDIAQFVPDNLPLDRLIAYTTSGTTGHPLVIPSHPLVAAKYSVFHKKALRWNQIEPDSWQSDVAVMLAGFQQQCFTYVSILPYLNNKGLLKLNFHPDAWSHADHRAKYLDDLMPDLITGDALSLFEVAKLNFTHRPKAVLSTSMALLKKQKESFEHRFSCPVIDIYSMNEAGPIAASVSGRSGFRLLQSELLVEILDKNGNPLPAGGHGEIVITGEFNHYLPLLRYRTGDYARLERDDLGYWYLMDLQGRAPVSFTTASGSSLNNVDITHLLAGFSLPQFRLHQFADGSLKMQIRGSADIAEIAAVLHQAFGASLVIDIETHQIFEDKVIQYTCDIPQ